ncbi:MAG TPA: endolytic transglycosylase MltG [Pseudomonadales bacterium]
MTGYLKLLLIALSAMAVLVGALAAYAMHWNQQPLHVTQETIVTLEPGQSFAAFANRLAEAGYLSRPEIWSALARVTGAARRVQAGEYRIEVGDTPVVLLDRLLAGRVVVHEVTLLEGWTVRRALTELAVQGSIDHELSGVDERTLLGVLGLPEGNAEGMFFPDTYRYERGTTDADILRRAYRKLQEELAARWEARDSGLPYETPYEALIVASLIEKETGREEERSSIAQVFVTRLHKGMRLQTDPSVIYGVGATFDGNLTRTHLRTDTPYNTYTRNGLPPTPIALAGARSIDSALHPAAGEFLYFVSRGDGTSHFSVSLEEHEAAVRRYQLP